MDDQEIRFDDFLLVPRSRLLMVEGRPVPIGSRAFELLHALLKVPGQLVAKEELVRQVWPTTYVEESNLRFQMASLRKALGQARDLIKTVPGRGYVFTGRCRGAVAAVPPGSDPAQEPAEVRPRAEAGPARGTARLLLFPLPSKEAPAERRSAERDSGFRSAPVEESQGQGQAEGRPRQPAFVLPVLILGSSGDLFPSGTAMGPDELSGLIELLRSELVQLDAREKA